METIKYKDLFPKDYVILKHTEEDLKAAVLAEREACALVCEGLSGRSYEYDMGRLHSAVAIRQRGEK